MHLISLNVDIILPLIMLILAKQLKPFLNVFKYNIHKCDNPDEAQKARRQRSLQ